MIDCPCGCGQTFPTIGSRGRRRSYYSPACSLRVNRVSGGGEGRRHTAETRAVLSAKASRPKPWIRGAKNGMAGRTGASNPNYKDGSSPERQRLYASAEWQSVRRQVLMRDNRRCVTCGKSGKLHIHHVKAWGDYPDLRLDPGNLIVLCRSCHHEAHRKGVRHQ